MNNLTYSEWSQLPAQKRAEYNANNIDTKKFEFDTEGILINLERIRGDISTVWERAYSFYEFENIFYRLKPQPTQAEITAKFVKDNNLKVGDKVKVIKKFENEEVGEWEDDLNEFIGKVGEVAIINESSISIELEVYTLDLPPQSLELYKPQYRPFESVAEFVPNKDRFIIDKAGNIATFQAIDSDCRVKYACHGKKTFQEAFRDFEFIDLITGERSPFGVEI